LERRGFAYESFAYDFEANESEHRRNGAKVVK
jgi:hypothetical protein